MSNKSGVGSGRSSPKSKTKGYFSSNILEKKSYDKNGIFGQYIKNNLKKSKYNGFSDRLKMYENLDNSVSQLKNSNTSKSNLSSQRKRKRKIGKGSPLNCFNKFQNFKENNKNELWAVGKSKKKVKSFLSLREAQVLEILAIIIPKPLKNFSTKLREFPILPILNLIQQLLT